MSSLSPPPPPALSDSAVASPWCFQPSAEAELLPVPLPVGHERLAATAMATGAEDERRLHEVLHDAPLTPFATGYDTPTLRGPTSLPADARPNVMPRPEAASARTT